MSQQTWPHCDLRTRQGRSGRGPHLRCHTKLGRTATSAPGKDGQDEAYTSGVTPILAALAGSGTTAPGKDGQHEAYTSGVTPNLAAIAGSGT
ncbi:MAG: hypothetical protein RBU30_03135, partial [Polyangia bacterium]|nr:hypothetical protein [Polyangia bacterium]